MTRNRSRLFILLAVALWLSLSAWVALLSTYELDIFTMKMLTYSLPALLFGGILFWWFGKGGNHQSPGGKT
jgi:hypothetical protein